MDRGEGGERRAMGGLRGLGAGRPQGQRRGRRGSGQVESAMESEGEGEGGRRLRCGRVRVADCAPATGSDGLMRAQRQTPDTPNSGQPAPGPANRPASPAKGAPDPPVEPVQGGSRCLGPFAIARPPSRAPGRGTMDARCRATTKLTPLQLHSLHRIDSTDHKVLSIYAPSRIRALAEPAPHQHVDQRPAAPAPATPSRERMCAGQLQRHAPTRVASMQTAGPFPAPSAPRPLLCSLLCSLLLLQAL